MKLLKKIYKYLTGNTLPNWSNIKNTKNEKENEDLNKKKILLATSSGGLHTALVFESFIGQSLKYRGAKVEYILCDKILPACIMATTYNVDENTYKNEGAKKLCDSCFSVANKYLNTTNTKVHRFSNFLRKQELEDINKLNLDKLSFNELKNFSEGNVSIGQHAYAGAVRYYAAADIQNEKYSKKILQRYVRSALITKKVFNRLFNEVKYDEVFINHGIYVPQGVVIECANKLKIKTSAWDTAYRKKTFNISRSETVHKSLLYEKNQNWEQINLNEKNLKKIETYLESRSIGKYDALFYYKNPDFNSELFFNKIKIDKNKPIIGMATNLIWDAQIYFKQNFFKNILEWIFYTIDFFIKNPHLQLIIRIHPAEVNSGKPTRQRVDKEISKRYSDLPNNIFIIKPEDNISSYAIFKKCNSVLIYASKMGIETPCMGIPTIVCGEGFIKNKNITIDINSLDKYDEILKSLPLDTEKFKMNVNRAKKYAYHFFYRRTIKFESLYEKKNKWPSIGISENLYNNLENKSDPGLETVIKSIFDGTDYILKDENYNDR